MSSADRILPSAYSSFERFLNNDLQELRAAHLLRTRRAVRVVDSTHLEIDGRRLVNFASNDYLGLTHHPRLLSAASDALQRNGLGSGAAALVTGYTQTHAAAERAISAWKGTADAVLLPSGYQANHAAIQTLATLGAQSGGVRFLVDKLAHASLIDAVRSSGQPFRIYPHNTLAKLSRLLQESEPGQLQVVVTESIFSMDGDAADLRGVSRLKQSHPFLLMLDEAHGTGVYGPAGAGYAAECGLRDAVDISVVTLSKAMGSVGGAVCTSSTFCEALVNHGRAFIYSTAVPAMVAAAAMVAIEVMRDEPQRQRRVRDVAMRLREAAREAGYEVPAGDAPIVPILIGGDEDALMAAAALRERGLLIPAIRPPTVPRGSARLRVTLSCEHTDDEVDTLIEALRTL